MKIIELYAENIKKIKAVEIRPTENMVIISGKNGQGKTSILDSIWFAIGGGAALKDTPDPIRKGQESAEVTLELDDMTITRTWNAAGNTYLKVESATGEKYKSPQAVIDALIENIAFDPLEFSRLKPAEQRNILIDVLGLAKDLEQLETEAQKAYEQRTEIGRDLKRAEAMKANLAGDYRDTPDEPIDMQAVIDELNAAIKNNRKIQEKKEELGRVQDRIKTNQYEILERQRWLESEAEEEKTIKAELESMQEIPEEAIQAKSINANAINTQVEAKKRYLQAANEAKDFEKAQKEKTREIEKTEAAKRELLAGATMPVAGMEIAAGEILYKGIPFTQISESEKLQISLAMVISLKPKLKVMRITDGSLLDNNNMEILKKIAEQYDFQIWIEKVDDTGKVGVYIEDGEVKANNYK